jgi:MinD-like ATPase involved in chromosome partitioning or flagellar assembly
VQTRIKDLFVRLQDAYRHRDHLWTDLEAVITATVDPALAALAEVPAVTERTIAALEKHAKTLAAKDDDGADKLRGVLAKFV